MLNDSRRDNILSMQAKTKLFKEIIYKNFPNGVNFDKLSPEEEKVLKQMGKDLAEDYISRLTPVQQMAFGVMPKRRYEKMIGPKTTTDILIDSMDLAEEALENFYERERIRTEKERKRYFEANYNTE